MVNIQNKSPMGKVNSHINKGHLAQLLDPGSRNIEYKQFLTDRKISQQRRILAPLERAKISPKHAKLRQELFNSMINKPKMPQPHNISSIPQITFQKQTLEAFKKTNMTKQSELTQDQCNEVNMNSHGSAELSFQEEKGDHQN